ncbi:hypothetical protein ACLRDC_19895 [Gluconacetobacter sacchari]|uniref:hypothetical protein n=1 Tax=Gluconacetobacter sacchari TaxID=92759 RepID=UPI0039B3D1F9
MTPLFFCLSADPLAAIWSGCWTLVDDGLGAAMQLPVTGNSCVEARSIKSASRGTGS